jgi:hypothetical protein
VLPQPKIRRINVKESPRPDDWTSASYRLFTESSGAVWQWGENEFVRQHEWTTCVVVDEEAHVTRIPVNHSQTNTWYTASVTLLGKTPGPKCWWPKMPSSTLIRPCLSRHWLLDICCWEFFAHLNEYFTRLKHVSLYNSLYNFVFSNV